MHKHPHVPAFARVHAQRPGTFWGACSPRISHSPDRGPNGLWYNRPCVEWSLLFCVHEVHEEKHIFPPKYPLTCTTKLTHLLFPCQSPSNEPISKRPHPLVSIVLTMSTQLPRLRGQPIRKRVWIFALHIPTQVSVSLHVWVDVRYAFPLGKHSNLLHGP